MDTDEVSVKEEESLIKTEVTSVTDSQPIEINTRTCTKYRICSWNINGIRAWVEVKLSKS